MLIPPRTCRFERFERCPFDGFTARSPWYESTRYLIFHGNDSWVVVVTGT